MWHTDIGNNIKQYEMIAFISEFVKPGVNLTCCNFFNSMSRVFSYITAYDYGTLHSQFFSMMGASLAVAVAEEISEESPTNIIDDDSCIKV